jgi:hypothetical protein
MSNLADKLSAYFSVVATIRTIEVLNVLLTLTHGKRATRPYVVCYAQW